MPKDYKEQLKRKKQTKIQVKQVMEHTKLLINESKEECTADMALDQNFDEKVFDKFHSEVVVEQPNDQGFLLIEEATHDFHEDQDWNLVDNQGEGKVVDCNQKVFLAATADLKCDMHTIVHSEVQVQKGIQEISI